MTWYREWFGEEYIELYAHRDEHEARQQVAFFREHLAGIDGITLDLACGMGRHLTEMNGEGIVAVGCDLSFTLLRAGMKRGPGSSYPKQPDRETIAEFYTNYILIGGHVADENEAFIDGAP